MSEEELYAPRTFSEHDDGSTWSHADHFVHTTLIEKNWNAMFRRHVSGEQGMDEQLTGTKDEPRSMEEILARVHAWTEEWKREHEGKPLDELVRIGEVVRADTLQLLSELSDEELQSKIPGAPWSDGTVGGIMAANADHGKMHWHWAEEDPVGRGAGATEDA